MAQWLNILGWVAAISRLICTVFGEREDRKAARQIKTAVKDVKEIVENTE